MDKKEPTIKYLDHKAPATITGDLKMDTKEIVNALNSIAEVISRDVEVNFPPIPQPIVNVEIPPFPPFPAIPAPEILIEAPKVTFPEMQPPMVNAPVTVNVPEITVPKPDIRFENIQVMLMAQELALYLTLPIIATLAICTGLLLYYK